MGLAHRESQLIVLRMPAPKHDAADRIGRSGGQTRNSGQGRSPRLTCAGPFSAHVGRSSGQAPSLQAVIHLERQMPRSRKRPPSTALRRVVLIG